jgi:excisionase family DNA binding protein
LRAINSNQFERVAGAARLCRDLVQLQGVRFRKEAPLTKLLTPAEAAEYLGVSVQTLYNWRSTKRVEVPAKKIGGKLRFREEDLQRFVEQAPER